VLEGDTVEEVVSVHALSGGADSAQGFLRDA